MKEPISGSRNNASDKSTTAGATSDQSKVVASVVQASEHKQLEE